MKIKISHLLASATIVFITLLSFASFAQDEGRTSNELQEPGHQEQINNSNEEDKTSVYEHDSKSFKNVSSETHQSTVIPAKAKVTETHKATTTPSTSNTKEGDDALSFNFLFYIIQKYKFSDIVDQ